MKTNLKLRAFYAFLLILPSLVVATEDGLPFRVQGEQLDYVPPDGWKLAFMKRKADDGFFAEYIPNNDDIHTWKNGFLLVNRMFGAEIIKEIRKTNKQAAEVAMSAYMELATKGCRGEVTPKAPISEMINGCLTVSGGFFCDGDESPTAPHGEGAFVSFIEGKDYLHRIQYSWRPQSKEELVINSPWHIEPSKSQAYLNALKSVTLCGGANLPACKIKYVD